MTPCEQAIDLSSGGQAPIEKPVSTGHLTPLNEAVDLEITVETRWLLFEPEFNVIFQLEPIAVEISCNTSQGVFFFLGGGQAFHGIPKIINVVLM